MAKPKKDKQQELLEMLQDILIVGGWDGDPMEKGWFINDFKEWRKRAVKLVFGRPKK